MKVDTLIKAGFIIPVEPEGLVLADHAIALLDGKIRAIMPSEGVEQQFEADEVLDLQDHILVPGLINAHTHIGMTLLRGAADDLPLMTWLQEHIWPQEQRWVGESFVADGSELAMAEMIRSGTTCFNDMYFFPEVTAEKALAAGMRANIGLILIDFPSAWAETPAQYLEKGLALAAHYADHPTIHTGFAPHAPYTVSDAPLEQVVALARELRKKIQMHVHETSDEVDQAMDSDGIRPLARLDRLGLLNSALSAVHMTQLLPEEIALLAERRVSVVHCPHSNLKLASGFCPVSALVDAGINVALGTDSSASNNSLDMLAEMKTAALLAKGVSSDATAVPAATALRMATLNGAKALGIDHLTGSLKEGKQADITALRLDNPESVPLLNPLSQVVYASSRQQVSHVWVNGRMLLREGNLTTLDEARIMQQSRAWQPRLSHTAE